MTAKKSVSMTRPSCIVQNLESLLGFAAGLLDLSLVISQTRQ